MSKKSVMAKAINDLFERFPFLYERAFCAAFHPYNLYAIRRLNPFITTAYIVAPNITTYAIRNASRTPRPVSVFLVKNVLFRWLIDSFFIWISTPSILKSMGADLICIEIMYCC